MGGAVERIRERGDEERAKEIVGVLVDAFDELMRADPVAFRRKFRKMAAAPFPFYRGTACLFYADMAHESDPWADERTSRVWIQGDLHAENFGTYMDASGTLVFDVNDFDEAYLGCFTWDLKRLVPPVMPLPPRSQLDPGTLGNTPPPYTTAPLQAPNSAAPTAPGLKLTIPSR